MHDEVVRFAVDAFLIQRGIAMNAHPLDDVAELVVDAARRRIAHDQTRVKEIQITHFDSEQRDHARFERYAAVRLEGVHRPEIFEAARDNATNNIKDGDVSEVFVLVGHLVVQGGTLFVTRHIYQHTNLGDFALIKMRPYGDVFEFEGGALQIGEGAPEIVRVDAALDFGQTADDLFERGFVLCAVTGAVPMLI